jgi:hypothetical protein
MNEEKILEAIEKVCQRNLSPLHRMVFITDLSKQLLTAIKPLLPPTDLVKVWEGKAYSVIIERTPKESEWHTLTPWARHRDKNIEVYIREVK